MKRFVLLILSICFFSFPVKNAESEERLFGWVLSNIWVYYDASQNRVSADIDILHFNWLFNNRFLIG
ncbi:MAG: hypothetical protein FWC36_03845 [Spirochaetes bacterium]|nr:hypothetical protein [Spirochaetota bacterium]